MAHIETRVSQRRDSQGRLRRMVRYKVRYRDNSGKSHSETVTRRADAERRKAEIELELADGRWSDPRRGDLPLSEWVGEWLLSRHDLRTTTRARLDLTMAKQVLPRFGHVRLNRISNAEVRRWVSDLLDGGLSAASTRKAVFALRQTLEAAVADRRLQTNAAAKVPLPAERSKSPRFLSQTEVERLAGELPARDRALVLVGAYGGLRWGEAAGLRRRDVDALRSRIRVETTAVQVGGVITLDNEPKTARSRRSVPIARSVMRRVQDHLDAYVGPHPDDLVFTAPGGGPLYRAWVQNHLGPAAKRAGLEGTTFHALRHSFVAILVAAGCNVREVSEWAGHSSVAFTLTRYGGLFEDGTDAAVDRLDELLGSGGR